MRLAEHLDRIAKREHHRAIDRADAYAHSGIRVSGRPILEDGEFRPATDKLRQSFKAPEITVRTVPTPMASFRIRRGQAHYFRPDGERVEIGTLRPAPIIERKHTHSVLEIHHAPPRLYRSADGWVASEWPRQRVFVCSHTDYIR